MAIAGRGVSPGEERGPQGGRGGLWIDRLSHPPKHSDKKTRALTLQEVVRQDMYLQALQTGPLNWGGWEIPHANPAPDPAHYRDTEGVLLTHAFNRACTVSSPKTFDLFRGPSGLAIVRHYTLNENMMFDLQDKEKLGYFVADVERAGPYCMLAEARAMAFGDPRFIGYLVGLNFNRGFPEAVRDFNRAFLSLPALPSQVLAKAVGDPEVVVRSIPAGPHGTYLAVVNTGLTAKTNLLLTLPLSGRLTDAPTGEPLQPNDRHLPLTLLPCQLRALRIQP